VFLGFALRQLGRSIEGIPYVERALELDSRLRGTTHVTVATDRNILGFAQMDQSQLAEAEANFRTAISIVAAGRYQEDDGIFVNNLGLLELLRGNLPEAQRLFESALAIHQEHLKPATEKSVAISATLAWPARAATLQRSRSTDQESAQHRREEFRARLD